MQDLHDFAGLDLRHFLDLALLARALGSVVLAVYEVGAQHERLKRLPRIAAAVLRITAPQLVAVIAVAGGAVLLLFGALPAVPERLAWLGGMFPLGMLEFSHFLASVVGVGLLLLEAAYYFTCVALGAGIVLTLLRGLQIEAAVVLAAMLLIVLPARPFFYRHASLLRQPLAPSWVAAVAVVLLAVGWIGLFTYRHVEYSSELWWQFALDGDASRAFYSRSSSRTDAHRRTVQIEISERAAAIGKGLQEWLRVPEARIEWKVADVLQTPATGYDFIYLYRPVRPEGPGLDFYTRFAREVESEERPPVIFSIADCLRDFLTDRYEVFYGDGHLTCFKPR